MAYNSHMVGKRYRLDPKKVTKEMLYDNGSDGTIGEIYTIAGDESFDDKQVRFIGNNWHHIAWLTPYLNLTVGGELYAG